MRPRGVGEHRRVLEARLQPTRRTVRDSGVSPEHVKEFSENKTDVSDAEWVAVR